MNIRNVALTIWNSFLDAIFGPLSGPRSRKHISSVFALHEVDKVVKAELKENLVKDKLVDQVCITEAMASLSERALQDNQDMYEIMREIRTLSNNPDNFESNMLLTDLLARIHRLSDQGITLYTQTRSERRDIADRRA